jgi:hypothetical protein
MAHVLDLSILRLDVSQLLSPPRRDRLNDDADRALGVALHDLRRTTDELLDRLTKRSDVALKRLGDQGVRNIFKLGVEHGLEPTPTLFTLRAELGLVSPPRRRSSSVSRWAATAAYRRT